MGVTELLFIRNSCLISSRKKKTISYPKKTPRRKGKEKKKVPIFRQRDLNKANRRLLQIDRCWLPTETNGTQSNAYQIPLSHLLYLYILPGGTCQLAIWASHPHALVFYNHGYGSGTRATFVFIIFTVQPCFIGKFTNWRINLLLLMRSVNRNFV